MKKLTDFYQKYGFDIGDSIIILAENDGRSVNNFSQEELDDLILRGEKGKIKSGSSQYGSITKDGIKGPYYEVIHIETESGKEFNCHPLFYRLYGRFTKKEPKLSAKQSRLLKKLSKRNRNE